MENKIGIVSCPVVRAHKTLCAPVLLGFISYYFFILPQKTASKGGFLLPLPAMLRPPATLRVAMWAGIALQAGLMDLSGGIKKPP